MKLLKEGSYYGPENMKNLKVERNRTKIQKITIASHHYSSRHVVSHNMDWSRTIGVILLPRSPMGDVKVGATLQQPGS